MQIIWLLFLAFYLLLAILESPGSTATAAFNLLQVLLRLTIFSLVNHATFLFVWKFQEVFSPCHSFESVHGKRSSLVRGEGCKRMDVYFVRLLILDISIPITSRTQLIRMRVQEEEKSIIFSRFRQFSVKFCNFK